MGRDGTLDRTSMLGRNRTLVLGAYTAISQNVYYVNFSPWACAHSLGTRALVLRREHEREREPEALARPTAWEADSADHARDAALDLVVAGGVL